LRFLALGSRAALTRLRAKVPKSLSPPQGGRWRAAAPIQVRRDDERHVLMEGLHRLEAARLLGETEIDALMVQARRH
jgi:hypothetical protein